MTTTLATAKTYLTNPVSGRVVCTDNMRCAGATLLADYRNNPDARGWLGINGEPHIRLDAADAAELRTITGGPVCDCEMSQ